METLLKTLYRTFTSSDRAAVRSRSGGPARFVDRNMIESLGRPLWTAHGTIDDRIFACLTFRPLSDATVTVMNARHLARVERNRQDATQTQRRKYRRLAIMISRTGADEFQSARTVSSLGVLA